jgi:hypothetical protein
MNGKPRNTTFPVHYRQSLAHVTSRVKAQFHYLELRSLHYIQLRSRTRYSCLVLSFYIVEVPEFLSIGKVGAPWELLYLLTNETAHLDYLPCFRIQDVKQHNLHSNTTFPTRTTGLEVPPAITDCFLPARCAS